MFCPDCGSEVAEGRRFCGKCGGLLHAGAASVDATQAALETPVQAAAPAPAQPASLRRKFTYALVALLVVLGGVAWWWFHRPAPAYKVQDPGIYPFQGVSADGKTVKTGFIDADGKVLVSPQWDAADSTPVLGQLVFCNEGFCGVSKDGKWGFIDSVGNLAIPTQFDLVGPFSEGLARVHLGNQVGYIDKTGRYVINPQFSGGGEFHGGIALVREDGGFGFINKTGTFVIKPQFPSVDTDGFSEGLAGACSGTSTFMGVVAGRCGYINGNGVFAIKPQFEAVQAFSEGLAPVRINNKWGYINRSGNIVVNPQFDSASIFLKGFAVVGVSGHLGTIDKQGKYVLNPGQYNLLAQGRVGELLPVSSGAEGIGLITRDGTWVVKPSKAIGGITATLGKVFYAVIDTVVPVSTSGKVLAGWYRGAMLDSLAQDIDNETSAIQSMRTLIAAESSYSNAYPARGFTDSLAKLGPSASGSAPDENHGGFIDATLASGTDNNYQFTVAIPAGTSTGGTNFNYQLTAKPLTGHFGRTLCSDSSGAVRYAIEGQECTSSSPVETTLATGQFQTTGQSQTTGQPQQAYIDRDCDGTEDGQPGTILKDLSQQNMDEFSIDLHPGCFSGYILIPQSWEYYRMQATDSLQDWWLAYKWYVSKNSSSGQRPPLHANDLLNMTHGSHKIRVQGHGRLMFSRLPAK
jgi:hypothetical protein